MVMNMSQKPSSGSGQVLVALDFPSAASAEALIAKLAGVVGGFKVGLELFTAEGAGFVRQLTDRGLFVFLDQKLHDIPNTVARASRVATRLGVGMFTVHAAGGKEMMREAVLASAEESEKLQCRRPLAIAITVLTSLTESDLEADGISCSVLDLVRRRAILAREAGFDGVVASPHEIAKLRSDCGDDFLIITPGIRPVGSEKADQKRVMTPREAISLGADYLVIGRPIAAADDPRQAATSIVHGIAE